MDKELFAKAKAVLSGNDRGDWTMPSDKFYPHQWLWDSCFIAIGLRHYNVGRAQKELESLLRGQWANGMMPDMIFSKTDHGWADKLLWDSYLSPYAPKHVATSGITQPPMMAEAVWLVGQKLPLVERRSWFKKMLPPIVDFHEWLYGERDPDGEGLVTLVHPYESGMDNSPPWMAELYARGIPLWVRIVCGLRLDWLATRLRRDTQHAPTNERMSNTEALSLFAALRRLRHQAYSSRAALAKPYLAVQDLLYNCILIRSNQRLVEIAQTAGVELPPKLAKNMELSKSALEFLWDEERKQYFNRSYVYRQLIPESSIATLMPLYAGCISPERAEYLAGLLKKRSWFKSVWPVPSTPQNSSYFNPRRYWQGPTWININWFIIDGLMRSGFKAEAEELKKKTLELVAKNGISEYYDPNSASPLGAANFSWTAALTIDLLKR